MRGLLALLTGLLTTVVFVGVGVPLLVDGQVVLGSVLTGLGALRAIVLLRDVLAARRADDEEEDDEDDEVPTASP